MRLFFLVCPDVCDHTSFIPAMPSIFLHSRSMHKPVPLGAGISFIFTDPHFPSTVKGTLCGFLQPHCQLPQPLAILIMPIFAFLMAFSLAGTVSLLFP